MKSIAAFLLVVFWTGSLHAEQFKLFDAPDGTEYELHYIAISSTFLDPKIAQQYGLIRSKALGLLNISLLKRLSDGGRKAESALVQGTVTNEIQQQLPLSFKQVIEGESVYYLAQAQYVEGQHLRFDIQVYPAGVQQPFQHQFSHAFFND